ncbi:hypothetical protein MOX01_02490 [Microbacterium oxydans]|nr:hypothetical protein MOX01_02490 [Microbacterium oxydans]
MPSIGGASPQGGFGAPAHRTERARIRRRPARREEALMKETRDRWKPNPVFSSMPHSMGRGSREDIVWEALDRVNGKPAPTMGTMQAAMGNEAQIHIVHDTIRAYLDAHGLDDTSEFGVRAGDVA